MRPDTGTACGDKPLVKRGHRVRAFLENLRTVYGRVKGEQGLLGKHLPVWDRGLPPVPAAPSPCCLVPACVPSSWHCHLLSSHPGRAGGWGHPGTCVPHSRTPAPSSSTGWWLRVLAGGHSPGWWLPQQGQGLDVTAGQDRAVSPPPACTAGSWHCVRRGCFSCLVPLGVTNQPKTPQSPPFSSCCGSGRILAAPAGHTGT